MSAAPVLRPLRALPIPGPRHVPYIAPVPTAAKSSYIQDTLAVDFVSGSNEQIFGRQPTRSTDLPDPQAWSARLAQALVEAMGGLRPCTQLVRWLDPEVYDVVARRSLVAHRRRTGAAASTKSMPRPRVLVRRVRLCEPADGVVEAAAVVIDGPRVRALAMRLVGLDGRWRLVALQIG